jgi:hypothetical protein
MLITWPGLTGEQATRKGETQDRSREVLVADFAWKGHWLSAQVDLLLPAPTAAMEQLFLTGIVLHDLNPTEQAASLSAAALHGHDVYVSREAQGLMW